MSLHEWGPSYKRPKNGLMDLGFLRLQNSERYAPIVDKPHLTMAFIIATWIDGM